MQMTMAYPSILTSHGLNPTRTKITRTPLTLWLPNTTKVQFFKFGVQVPKNAVHAKKLDKLSNNNLWEEANKKELKSLKDFKTFRVLEDHEKVPDGYIRIPYHFSM